MKVIFLMVIFCASMAYSDYCSDKGLGWHFYCDPNEEKLEVKTKERRETNAEVMARLGEVKRELEERKARAVLTPTEENIRDYIAYHNQQLDRAEKFSEVWERVLWKRPELDFSVKAPQSIAGNDVLDGLKKEKLNKVLSKFTQRYGLFFFYSSKCSFCHKYSGILKIFSDFHKINVMAISLDGGILPEWPNSVIDRGESVKMGMAGKPVPATILFDSHTKDVIPVGFGLLSVVEIEERIVKLIGEGL